MTPTPAETLAIAMEPNDADAETIGDYLRQLLLKVWEEGEGFSGKRPFGNSGWDSDVYQALVKAGAIDGTLDEDGYLEDYDEAAATDLMTQAILTMGGQE